MSSSVCFALFGASYKQRPLEKSGGLFAVFSGFERDLRISIVLCREFMV